MNQLHGEATALPHTLIQQPPSMERGDRVRSVAIVAKEKKAGKKTPATNCNQS